MRKKILFWIGMVSFALALVSIFVLNQIKQAVCARNAADNCNLGADFQFNAITAVVFLIFTILGAILYIISMAKK